MNAWHYHWNASAYKRGDHRAWTGPEFAAWIADIAAKIETDADREVLGDSLALKINPEPRTSP
jgi:hypothetical protein